jgi:hypothetical protein
VTFLYFLSNKYLTTLVPSSAELVSSCSYIVTVDTGANPSQGLLSVSERRGREIVTVEQRRDDA